MKPLISLLLITFSSYVLAQSTVVPGSVVLSSGDTINGFVHDLQWESNPATVEFQKTIDGESHKYAINEIRAFSTSRGVLFERHEVEYDGSKEQLNMLSVSREPEYLTRETVLLEILVKGPLSLSTYADRNNRKHFFLHQQGENPKELLNRSYIVTNSGQPAARQYEPWRQHLFVMAADCPALRDKIKHSAKYSSSSLTKIIEELNACLGYQSRRIAKNSIDLPKSKPRFGLAIHPFFSRVVVETSNDYARSDFSTNGGVGVFVEIFPKKRRDRLSLYNEIKYKRIEQSGLSDYIYKPSFAIQSIKLVNCIRFFTPLRKTYFITSVGLTNGYRKTNLSYTNTNGGSLLFVRAEEEKGFENGLIAGVGLRRMVGKVQLSLLLTADKEMLVFYSPLPDTRTASLGLSVQAGI